MQPDVLVMGGGIVGVTTAAYLARAGASVVLVERADLASGPSGRSQGLVGGPHPPAVRELAARSLAAYRDLAAETGAFGIDRDDVGCLLLADDASELPDEAEPVDAAEAEPLLAPRFGAAGLIECRRIDPAAAVAAWGAEARRHGADLRTGVPARSLAVEGDRVVGAHTDAGFLAAGTTVLATGWEAPRVLAALGRTLDVVGVRGWIAVTRATSFGLRRPIMEMGHKQAFGRFRLQTVSGLARGETPSPATAGLVHQDASGRVVLGSSLTHATGAADREGAEALSGICARAVELLPGLADVAIAETRTCVRPVSADGLPYLGPLAGIDGLVVAAGHGGTGVTLGPGSGELVARGILDGAWDANLVPDRAGAAQTERVVTA